MYIQYLPLLPYTFSIYIPHYLQVHIFTTAHKTAQYLTINTIITIPNGTK